MRHLADPIANQIVDFLRGIGLKIEMRTLDEPTVLPGIAIAAGKLIIDEAKLLYPGDLLHEGGHLALLTADERALADGRLPGDGGSEMGAIAWSYAAARHIGIAPEIVFHEQGYSDGSNSLLENFREGYYLAVPLLQWMGLTLDEARSTGADIPPYPHMIRWLRD